MEIVQGERKGSKKTALTTMADTLCRMSGMIDHLLAVARLNFSKEKLHKTEITVDTLLEEAYHDCFVLAEDRGILLSYASDPVRILGDRDRLKEVILNLISNALKHTARGGKIVLFGKLAGEHAEISVKDTGSGIASEHVEHIFDRFYRIRGTDCPGTGLGLDICKKIMEMHEGASGWRASLAKGAPLLSLCRAHKNFVIMKPKVKNMANAIELRGGLYLQHSGDLVLDNEEKHYVMRLRDLPTEEKPREKLAKYGPAALSVAELLTIVLNAGTKKGRCACHVSAAP